MPTPVQHLVVAEAILSDVQLADPARRLLAAHRAAFLFGSTAPDVQTVSGQPREATHFFNVPLDTERPAHAVMFEACPDLGRPDRLAPAHAAFLAGYITHLLLDVMWVRDIFAPVFGPDMGWSSFRDRLFLHNVLRAWCDRRDQARLVAGAGELLAAVRPDRWLPFTADAHLRRWRDVLVEQFAPGAVIRTVQVFAERGQVAPEAFERVLSTEDRMDELIFSHISRAAIEDFYTRGLAGSRVLINDYLGRA
ncbi:MAG TPA: zinc dependent phospholipase C family protein [Anaerolineae bacterium]|nr:zinc dependent phospholipase C family protein [Anaerolineae bacterium]